MSSDERFDDLEAELRALAGSLDVPAPPPERVAAAVRARLAEPRPARRRRERWRVARWQVARWQVVAAVLVALVAVTAATPQGRQAVTAILRYAGIELRLGGETPAPVPAPAPLPGEREVPAGEVAGQVAFPVRTLTALGEPERVTVSDGGRVVSMFWPDGIRLDQFDGRMEPFFFKRLGAPFPEETEVDGVGGFWLRGSHPLGHITRENGEAVPLRQAGPTLIWQSGEVGHRLEGAPSMARAVELAGSLR
ncbi:hypothetical protein OUY22_16500 [Nonomuraea sp. MCN248]|uniref:DUF4367 domain-containing protein n=1 Tax=Nonomuraea corallina TaxID=2989783 RepID=A0ABT4SD02_9ACTN|nr:hypothetical protein [Nonomuraea corallina]MDA0635020.1 hypothetical protein [Nonomuraea corallina]